MVLRFTAMQLALLVILYATLVPSFTLAFQDSKIHFPDAKGALSDLHVPLEFTISFTLSHNILLDEAIQIKLPRFTRRLKDFTLAGHMHGLYVYFI